tara:strand:- start:41 stop:1942 length:1902 start_codon:yes stop_codon:yes gene_type:complete
MSCDKLVYDLASETEGSPSVFVRKDWLNILDNQSQNYSNNQSILDTSQLSNSNKWMSYREAYLLMPLQLTIAIPQNATAGGIVFLPSVAASTADYSIGLKNWFGQMIHSLTLDYNGTTIIQQTPFINMWNCFKLLSTLSFQDLLTIGPTIGFYPDDSSSFEFHLGNATQSNISPSGTGCCNNTNLEYSSIASAPANTLNNFSSGAGNTGFLHRQTWINFNPAGIINGTSPTPAASQSIFSSLISTQSVKNLYKSYISQITDQTAAVAGQFSISVTAQIYLKHLSSFFDRTPLLKGVFMKLTLNLNNASSTVVVTQPVGTMTGRTMHCSGVSVPIGGVNPLMVASSGLSSTYSQTSAGALNAASFLANGGVNLLPRTTIAGGVDGTYTVNVSVGGSILDRTITSMGGINKDPGNIKSVYLYIPAYIFNPVFEQAYLSSPIKHIKYTDVYQYQILGVANDGQLNHLVTNGIANIKSVLMIPFYSTSGTAVGIYSPNSGFVSGVPVYQSPFDSAGCGTTSPLCHLSNFNVQISGQNAIYNLQKYTFEEFSNQLYGQYSVNGGLTDGLSSGLISKFDFEMLYCYYYVNVERMLPVEQSVPKSVQILGTNMSTKTCDYWVFVEYGVDIKIDAITGARV